MTLDFAPNPSDEDVEIAAEILKMLINRGISAHDVMICTDGGGEWHVEVEQ